jgi:Lamin Tail Domain/Bacterial Ig-like domain/CHU_C Type IX secretion signal domain
MSFNKKNIIAIICTCFFAFTGLSQINENFTDGDFTNNPTWNGNTNDYSVVIGKLRSNNSVVNSKYYLSTPNSVATNCQWEFYVNLQLNTSSLNYTDVFLISNNSDLSATANINGYFLRFGGTKDEINLYKRSGTTESLLIDSRDGELNKSNNIYKIKVIRNTANTFRLYTDSTGTGNVYVLRDSVNDNSYLTSTHFGFNIAQSTASFFLKHFFDDIYVGPIIVDITPPQLLSTQLVNNNQVKLTFNEAIDTTYAKNLQLYNINNANNQAATSVTQVVPNKNNLNEIDLFFNPAITKRGTYTCFVTLAKDVSGNVAFNLNQSFVVSSIEKFDIVFNELMVDPSPVVGLPDIEYIELFNMSGLDLDLKNSKIAITSSSTTTKTITTNNIILKKDSFLVICDAGDTVQLKASLPSYVKIIGVASLPALTNEKALIQLLDANNTVISFINYSDTWYQEGIKKDGGWSLEQIDPENPCGEISNWRASTNSIGGTPGKKNSVFASNKDLDGPTILKAIAISSDTLQLYFNEKLSPKVIDTNIYFINKGLGKPSAIAGYSLTGKTLKLKVNTNFQVNTLYMLTVNDSIADCQGNEKNQTQSIEFALPLIAKSNELQINEILFNPRSGGKEFIEIYNNSNNYFDLSQYALAGYDSVNNTLQDVQKISSEGRLIKPFEYILISADGNIVKQQYPKGKETQFTSMASFPSLDDKSEAVYLLDQLNNTVDYVKYNDAWHYALLKSKDGVSLERLSNSIASNDKNNWTSAASTEDYGTPGYKNSQSSEIMYSDVISFQSSTFSPDNDGYHDLLIINYSLDNSPQSATIDVYDAAGIKVKNLANNIFISNTGTITWDGVKDNNEKANIGNYILVLQLNDDKGKTKVIKKLFAVGAKVD